MSNFCFIVGISDRIVSCDKSLPHESGLIHIQGMHIAAASSLHHCRDLVCLSFADEVEDGIRTDKKFGRCHAGCSTAAWDQSLADDSF